MNKQIGDKLAAEGIALIPFYGSCVSYYICPPPMEKTVLTLLSLLQNGDWCGRPDHPASRHDGKVRVGLLPDLSAYRHQAPSSGGSTPHLRASRIRMCRLELVDARPKLTAFQDSPTFTPNVFNSVINGRPAYSTSDLLERHHTKHNLFRVFGRADDQLMLSTGEKTNPAPLGEPLYRLLLGFEFTSVIYRGNPDPGPARSRLSHVRAWTLPERHSHTTQGTLRSE